MSPLSRRAKRRTFTPNQVIAYNLARARLLRGWTQDEAAEAIAPYLGSRLSAASFSAAERSVEGVRIREFNADELLALARGFGVPIGWFLTPPPEGEEIGLATPDAGRHGLDPMVLLDAVLGTEETLPYFEELLAGYSGFTTHRVIVDDDGAMLNLGREQPRTEERLSSQIALRAAMAARQAFGDLGEASAVLRRLASMLDAIDETPVADELVSSDDIDFAVLPEHRGRVPRSLSPKEELPQERAQEDDTPRR